MATLRTTDEEILAALAAPFASIDVEWRPQGKANSEGKTRVLPYLTGSAVTGRLNAVCGMGWSFDWSPISTDAAGEVHSAKGTLTIAGVSRSNVGTASDFEQTKGCITDTLKRCAVLFGVGTYLADIPEVWCRLDAQKRIPAAMLASFANRLDQLAAEAATKAILAACNDVPARCKVAVGVN